MKFAILLIVALPKIGGLKGQTDSIINRHNSFNIEVGIPTSIFFDNKSKIMFPQKNLYKPFSEYLPPFTFNLTYMNKKLWAIALKYKYFEKTTTYNNRNQGDVISRVFHTIDFGVGKRFIKKSFSFQPSLFLSSRPSGMQRVLLDYIPGGWNEPITTAFAYRSLGFGLGFNIQKNLYRAFNVSFETIYNHYFEKTNVIGRKTNGYDEFYKTYKVERNLLTFTIKLGYEITFKK